MMRISLYFPEFENIFYISSYLSLPPLRFHPGKTFADILPAAQRLQLLESLATVIHKKHHLPSIGWFPQIVDRRNQMETWPKASGLPVEFPSPPVIAWHMWTRLVVPVKRSKPRGPVLLEHFDFDLVILWSTSSSVRPASSRSPAIGWRRGT